MPKNTKPLIFGIAGGSCSGKTTLSRKLHHAFGGEQKCTLIFQDSYYVDQSSRFREDGGDINFDHPQALDFELLGLHLKNLKNGLSIKVPHYDFKTHSRSATYDTVDPRQVIIVDGTLILSKPQVFCELHASIFLNIPEEIRFDRRKRRDVSERGRKLEGVIKQFENHVKPMHDLFVQPSCIKATMIESTETLSDDLINDLAQRLLRSAQLADQ